MSSKFKTKRPMPKAQSFASVAKMYGQQGPAKQGQSRMLQVQSQTKPDQSRMLQFQSQVKPDQSRMLQVQSQVKPDQSRMLQVQSQTKPGQSRMLQVQSQTKRGQSRTKQGQSQTKQGQSRVLQVQNQAKQGQSRTKQGQSQTHQGQSQTHQGQSQTHQGQSQTHQGQSLVEQGQSQSEQFPNEDDELQDADGLVNLVQSPSQGAKDTVGLEKLAETLTTSAYFFPLFYAGERGALGVWEKHAGLGHIKRRLDDDPRKGHVIELANAATNTGSWIRTPRTDMDPLHITLPHLVLVLRSFRRNFSFEILILDNRGMTRRFCFATWFNPSNLKKYNFLCHVPLKLEVGWNEVQVDLIDLVRTTYRTRYLETLQIQVYANCRIKQIFFCDDQIMNCQLTIPSMRQFDNVKLISQNYGPLNHPNFHESGPVQRKADTSLPDPPRVVNLTRPEKDILTLQRLRYDELKEKNLLDQYKHFFVKTIKDIETEGDKGAAGKLAGASSNKITYNFNYDLSPTESQTGTDNLISPVSMKNSNYLMQMLLRQSKSYREKQIERDMNEFYEATVAPDDTAQDQGLYKPLETRPPSGKKDREPFYFRPANRMPPPSK